MNLNEYQKLAMRTSPDGHDRMMNGCMGLIGESGEVVDIVKKWMFQSGDRAELPKDKLIEELGDVLWYCAEISTGMKADMMEDAVEGLSYDGRLHIESLFLAKLCQSVTDAWLYPDEFMLDIRFIVLYILDLVGYMLRQYCNATLEECMERNVEKLKRRYPDGFDPERSMNRPEYADVGE